MLMSPDSFAILASHLQLETRDLHGEVRTDSVGEDFGATTGKNLSVL